MAPRVIAATRGGAVAVAIGLAVGTILVTDALVVAGIFVAAGLDAAGSMAPGGPAISAVDLVGGIIGAASMGIFLFVIGAIVVGIPISVVVLPAAFIWAAAVRLLARHGWAR